MHHVSVPAASNEPWCHQLNQAAPFTHYSRFWAVCSVLLLLLLLLLSHISRVQLCATPETAFYQAPPSLGFSRQEHWSGLPFPSPMRESEKWKWSRSVVSDSSRPHRLQPTRLPHPWDSPGKNTGVGCHFLLQYMKVKRESEVMQRTAHL